MRTNHQLRRMVESVRRVRSLLEGDVGRTIMTSYKNGRQTGKDPRWENTVPGERLSQAIDFLKKAESEIKGGSYNELGGDAEDIVQIIIKAAQLLEDEAYVLGMSDSE